jgi:hypothetical protein
MAETSGILQFTEYHQPLLPDGDYRIEVTQEILAGTKISKDNQFTASLNFSVFGPRFTLDPQEIQAIFPPAGSLGDHANVLPHIILNRSTLPWERRTGSNEAIPWLALLLFTEEEQTQKVKTLSKKISDLAKNPKGSQDDPSLKAQLPQWLNGSTWLQDAGDHPDDPVTVIEIVKSLLEAVCLQKN